MLVVRQTHVLCAVGLCVFLLVFGAGYQHVTRLPVHCSALETKELRSFCGKMNNVKSKLIQGTRLRIMPVGDSITAGPMGTNSYRGNMVEALYGANDVEMVGEVFWGTMEEDKYNRLEASMGRSMQESIDALTVSVPKWKPNVVLLHVGGNEIIGNEEEKLATLPPKLEEMLQLIQREVPDALTLVAQVIPCAFRGDKVERWNQQLYEVVAKRVYATKQKILTVDMYTEYPSDGLMDVAHPNEKGYKVMAERWIAAMEMANGMGWLKSSNVRTNPPDEEPEAEEVEQEEDTDRKEETADEEETEDGEENQETDTPDTKAEAENETGTETEPQREAEHDPDLPPTDRR